MGGGGEGAVRPWPVVLTWMGMAGGGRKFYLQRTCALLQHANIAAPTSPS